MDKLISLTGKKVKCYIPRCKHFWLYKGKSAHYITCPKCYSKLNVKRLIKEKIQRIEARQMAGI